MSEYLFGVGVVDTMIGFPSDPEQVYGVMRRALCDRESREEFVMPVEVMYDFPDLVLHHNAAKVLGLDGAS